MHRQALWLTALFLLTACGGTSPGGPPSAPLATASPFAVVPCSSIEDLRSLGTHLAQVTNPATHDTMEYTIVGDGAVSKDVLVMFPGTGQLLTGWPVQMLTNSTYSPLITKTVAYDALEDGPVSLCHNYRIALFDYPGVGVSTTSGSNITRDMISSDVDAMLNDAATRFSISTNVVDPVGWSLGTTNAEKYAVLSPVSRPTRTIHNLILIAGNAGGSRQAQVGGDSASCVTTMFDASLTASGSLKNQLDATLTEMIFPYLGQTAQQSGTNSGCAATVTDSIDLSVTPDCGILNHCLEYIASSIVDINSYPWSLTGGLDTAVYTNERELSNDFDVAYCSGAGPNFTSTGCTAYGAVKMSEQNGGICQTDTSNPDVPVSSSCVPLTMTGKMTVINGYEDLLTQWTYGKALVDAYVQQYGASKAVLDTYPGAAGHGVMIQHPLWTQTEMAAAMQ